MPGKVKGLAHWCKKVTEGYRGGEVTDMSSCWKNGLAFCALIHRFRPHLIDYGSLSPENIYENNELAYSIAEKEFGIMSLLDPKDMVEMACPDRKSVAIYVSQIYDYFKDEQIVEREVEYKTEIKDINTKDSKNDFAENASKLTDETNMEFVLDSNGNTDNASVNISVAVTQDILKDCENSDRKITVQTSDGITEVVSANRKDSISDIDDIFEANAALLQEDVKDDLKEETELERKGKDVVCDHDRSNTKDCDLCEEIEIPDSFNGTFKADAVLKAAVCAGITAVAITAGGDTENEIEAMKTTSNAKKSQNETDIEKNENMSIPEIQITFIEERLSADEKERTPYLVKSTEKSDASASLEYASPEVETKIKSMHEQSLATSSSDSFQSAEYVIVHDNDQQTQGKINVRNEIEKEEADADQLVLVLADVDSSAEINDTCLNSMKATGSVSSESFTSTSSLVSTDSSSSNPGSKNIASQEKSNKNPPDILNTKAIVPDKDSEIEIFVDEDDEEPPALPAVGPPPLPEQIEGIPFTQEEVIIQGELEVLCSEPVSTIITENTDMGKTPVQKDISDEKLTSNESNYLHASSVDAVPDSTAENVSAVVQRETIAEGLSEEQISCVISQDIGSALNENLSQDLSLDIATQIADTEKTVNPERVEIDDSQGQPLDEMPGKSNFEISHPSSENKLSAQIENIVTHCESFADKSYEENTDNVKFSLPDKAGLKESRDKEGKNDAEITSTGSTEVEKSEETYDIIHDEEMQSSISRAEQDSLQCNEKLIATLVDSNQSSPVLRKESVTSSENDTLNIKHSVKADHTDPLLNDEQDLMIEKDAVKENMMNQTVSNESREYGDSSYIDKIIDNDASKIITAPIIASGVKVEEFEKPSLLNKGNKVDEHAKDGSEGKDAELKDSSAIISSGKSAKIEDAIDRDNILQKDTGGKPRKTYMRTPLKWDANADVDINLLKKAKEMSKRMAEKQINSLQSPSPSEEVSEKSEAVNAKDSLLEDSDKQVRSEKSMNKDKEKDEARSRRLEILRQLQKSTRPTKKRIGDAELEISDSFSDSSADFKSKMKLWNRKSSTTQEPDEIISSSGSSTPDSTSRKSFPAFSTSPVQTPSSPRDDQSNLQKLTQSLPSSPRPGSVAEYVRRISLSSQCRPDSETDISSVPNKSLFNGTEVLRRERPPIENRDKVLFRRSTGTVSPAFVLSRPARNSQPIKVSVKPLVQRYTEKEQTNEKHSPAPVPSPKPSRYSGDFSLIVKPLNDKYALSDEESKTKKQEEKKEELERKDSLNRRNPPKRNMSITRPRSRSSSRERNIWQHDYNSDVITSPTIDKGPSVTRKDSFEVKVRPVSLQLSKDEMDNDNNDKNNMRRHSLSNANSGSKVNISVQPLSSRPRTVSASVATEPTVSKKPVPNKIATPQNQTTSTLAPTVSMGTQERQSRPRSSLSPRWTSKVDSSRPVPKSEPLSITTKHPGNNVLSYVQSCLNQKTAPKSLQEKAAANRRPATFTSADISRPSIVHKKSVTGAIQSDNQPTLKQPVKGDSVSICSSIFASKPKLKYDRDRAGYSNENMPGKSTGDNIDSHKILSPENTETSSTSSSASSSFVDLSEQEKLLVSPTSHIDGSSDIGGEKIKDIEVEIIDLVKETMYQEPEQKLCQKEEALKDTNIDISFPDEISLTDAPRTPKSENKSTSDNSVSSSFSDSESEKDNAIKKSVSHIKLSYKKENAGAVEPSFKEMPEAVTEKAKSPKILNRTDERSLDKPLSVSSTSSIDSIDHKSDVESLDTEARLFENKEVTCIKEMFEEMPDLVNKLNTPDYVASVHVKPFDEAVVTPLLKSSVGNAPDDDKHEDIHTESDHSPKANVITKQRKDSGIVDDKADTKIDLQTDTSDDSESDSSQSEDKNKCQNLSSQSTSSTSSAEIEKPELKEGLKNIILELEKELVNNLKDDDTAQVESSDTVDSAVCLPVTTSIAEIKPDNVLNMNEDLTDNVYQPKVDIEKVSEKDLFEDFDNLVSSLKNNEDIAVFAKELEVVAEDEIEEGDMRQEPYTSDTDDRRKQSFGEKKPKTGEDSNFNQKDETIEAIQNTPVLASIGKVVYDENAVAKEVVILSHISPEFSEPETNTKNPEEETITQGSAIVPHLNVTKEETLKSSSSSSSSTSHASRTSLKEEAEDDELLRNVIEDYQPFKAPLLEQIIDSSKPDKNFADSTNLKFEAFQPLSDDLLNVSDSTEITINENQKDGGIGEVVSGEDENALSNNLKLVSIIESEDPIILSAVADANNINSPLEVNVSVFESSFQDTDRISPVLFPEEEVLKQHGFTDVIGETLEDDPILLSAIANVKAEERKEIFRKDSDKSSNDSSDSEHAVETEAKKEDFESDLQKANGTDDTSSLENFLTEDVKSEKKSETMNNSSSSAKRPTDSESSISSGEMENADGQSAQSENESEDGMKYKFRGKDGNCYLLLDNDPTSPVAKTLISMEKEKSENLKNSSLSSMSDEQIQDAIDSINLKHSQYIPVSGITVSLKNPEYFLNQKFDPFEVEFIEPQKDFVIETEQLDSEQILLENDKSSNLHDAVVTHADNENLKPDLCEFTTEQASENESSEEDTTGNKEIKPVIQGDEPVIESDLEQGENEEISDSLWKGNQGADEAVVQYDLTSKSKNTELNQTTLKSVGHIELSGSETSSSSSSKYTESKPHKKKKKRKTKKNKRPDSENLKDKFKNTIQRSERNRYTSSSESDFDGKTSSDLKKTVPIENIELVDDHKLSFSNEENDEKKICCELEQDCNEQKINELQFINENGIDLEFVKETDDLKSSPEKEEKLNDSDTSSSKSDFDGETSSDLKKTVPIENIELVGDHKLSFSNEDNDEKKICCELEQDSSEQKITEVQFVNENDIDLEFVKETDTDDLKSSPEKEEKLNDSGTSSSENDFDGEISSDLKKNVPIENIELVGDHKLSFSNEENDEKKICRELEQDSSDKKINEVQFINENDIDLEFVKETFNDDLSPTIDLKSSLEKEEKLNDSDTLELNNNCSDRNKTLRQSKSSETNSSSSDSVSSAESSESDTETEKNVVNIDKDTITVDKTKSKVYHSDDNLKSDISDESDSGSTEINKHTEIKEPSESEFSIKCQGVSANYENWPITVKQLDIKCKEVGLDTDNKEDFDNNNEFLIGREKDPSKSEVARLIQQSLEQDRKRDDIRRHEQDRYKDLQDKVLPRDEVLEHEHIRHLSETSSGTSNKEEDQVDLDESSQSGGEDEIEEMGEDVSEDLLGGEATPMSMPSMDEVSSPDEQPEKPVVEVFDLQESSGDDISPDMESQALFVKLKEAQCKNAVLEAEMAKLKAKIIVLENTEGQKRQYEKKCEEMATRLLDMEKKVNSARKEINHYQDMMEGSQGQYIALEKKMQGDVTAIEKKYHKAKKIIKEYQQREKDFLAERESLLQQQTEKDQQYNALVKSLKDRIFQLEKELAEAQRAAGLPIQVPPQGAPHPIDEALKKETIVSEVIAKVTAPVAQSTPVRVQDTGSPVMSPTTETASVSSESDNSVSEPISLEAEMDVVDGAVTFESIPKTELLDTSASRDKAQLASAIPSRRPPTKQRSKSQESIEGADDTTENKNRQSGLESWTRHDSEDTVKKSDLKKRKAQQQGAEASEQGTETPPPESLPPPPPPPSAPAPSLPESDDGSEHHRDRQDSMSGESCSTVSQTSYDPSKPSFRGMDSEIPASDTVSIDTAGTTETAGSGSSAGAAGQTTFTKKSKGIKIPKLPFKFGGGDKDTGGVLLVSNRSLNSEGDSEGGITLISKKKLDSADDFDGASTISDVSSSYMVGEMDEGGKSSSYNFSGTPANEENPSQPSRHNQNQISSGAISQWNNEHVCHWLLGIEMEKYTQLFKEKSITGIQLALLDANKLKAMGIANAKDREVLKKKIKELKVALDKERKQMEKERKLQEKEQRAREKGQKKLSKKK